MRRGTLQGSLLEEICVGMIKIFLSCFFLNKKMIGNPSDLLEKYLSNFLAKKCISERCETSFFAKPDILDRYTRFLRY